MLVRWTKSPLDRLVDETFGLANWDGGWGRSWVPAVSIAEDPKGYRLSVEVPGVKPEDVKIEVDGNRLVVAGEKKHASEEKDESVLRFERSYGSFRREFVLPETVNADGISAKSEHGVLVITLPKTEKALPRKISVAA
jgi:HSP20 family protein